MNFDIAIVGNSYAGMICALTLAKISADFRIAIIEKENVYESKRTCDGRAYAISSASLRLFKKIGIFLELQEVMGEIFDIEITDNKASRDSISVLNFLSQSASCDSKKSTPILGAIIENHFIFEALKKQVRKQENITVFCPNSYQEISFCGEEGQAFDFDLSCKKKVEILLNDQTKIAAKLLLACDGRFSNLRKAYEIKVLEKNYQQTAITCKIRHEFSHENVAFEKFFAGGPLAVLPLKNQNESSIVFIVPNQQAEVLLAIDDENFTMQLAKKMPPILGKIELISQKFFYPLVAVLAEKFYHQQLLLIGDAACGVHPIAGQGLNLAIANIEILQELIAQNLRLGLDIAGAGVVREYDQLARKNAKKMLFATDILNSLFETKNPAIALLRNFGLAAVEQMPSLKNFFIKNAGGF